MIGKIMMLLCCSSALFGQRQQFTDSGHWTLILQMPDHNTQKICVLPDKLTKRFVRRYVADGIQIDVVLVPGPDFTSFKIKASSGRGRHLYFSLRKHYQQGDPYNFNGEVTASEIYRQSPHDTNAWIAKGIAEQAVPVVAVKSNSRFEVALSSAPAFYDNFTSQEFNVKNKTIDLSSGDNGMTPGMVPEGFGTNSVAYNKDKDQVMSPGKVLSHYHLVAKEKPHLFEGIIFSTSQTTVSGLRREINRRAAFYFSAGRYKDYFGALAFTTAYMNLRVNETGKSKYWVVPSVEYSNTQYCRDAFWISTMLSPEMSAECLSSELAQVNTDAEYPLMAILWAYRSHTDGRKVDLARVQAYVDSVEARAKKGFFYSYTEKDGRMDFQYWMDIMAFEKDDVVTYNQGLFALALKAASKMGLHVQTDPETAAQNYRGLFNSAGGFYPLSKKKNTITGPDPVVPDLLSLLYFKQALLPDSNIRRHYQKVTTNLKTAYGYKVVAQQDGRYLASEQYDVDGYQSQANRDSWHDGQYGRGGSFFLYDNLMLINAYLHGIEGAEAELLWRISIDFKAGGTTYECMNTQTGDPWKPNMGWNVAVYFFWSQLVETGKASGKLFSYLNGIAQESTLRTFYYVSSENGSDISGRGDSLAPFRTVAFAASQAKGSGRETIFVGPGLYVEHTSIMLKPGTSLIGAGEKTTIITTNGELSSPREDSGSIHSKIRYQGSLIELVSPAYKNDLSIALDVPSSMTPATDGNQVLSGFTIDGNNRKVKAGIWVQNRNNVSMHDVTIRNFQMRGAVFARGDMLADMALPEGSWMHDTKIYNCTFIHCGSDMADESLGNLCLAGLDGADIHHLTIKEDKGYGIKFIYYGHFRNLKIHDCLINVPESDPLWGEDISIELWNLSYGNEVYNIQCNTWCSFVNQVKFHDYEPTLLHPINLKIHGMRIIDQDGNSSKESVECALSGVEIFDSYFQDKALGIAIWGGAGWGGTIQLHDVVVRNNVFVNLNRKLGDGFGNNSGVFIPDPVHDIYISNNVFDRMGNAIQLNGSHFSIQNNVFLNTREKDVDGGSQVLFSNNLKFDTGAAATAFIGNTSGANNIIADPGFERTGDRWTTYYSPLSPRSTVVDNGIDIGRPYTGKAPEIGWKECTTAKHPLRR